jgi:heme O synthase-like polyprenyltransferase
MAPMFSALGLTTTRRCMVGWVISAVVLIVGLVFTFTPNPVYGVVLFTLGAVGVIIVALALLRVRKQTTD